MAVATTSAAIMPSNETPVTINMTKKPITKSSSSMMLSQI
ncbi:Uncharacterised protein [Klebsiella pneumoniae]|nr:Uncharacterised protein [Klebsiella pneumoniae]